MCGVIVDGVVFVVAILAAFVTSLLMLSPLLLQLLCLLTAFVVSVGVVVVVVVFEVAVTAALDVAVAVTDTSGVFSLRPLMFLLLASSSSLSPRLQHVLLFVLLLLVSLSLLML